MSQTRLLCKVNLSVIQAALNHPRARLHPVVDINHQPVSDIRVNCAPRHFHPQCAIHRHIGKRYLGNLSAEFGAEAGEATVFIAHMDEVGWEIT
jgi:hypothetical protein